MKRRTLDRIWDHLRQVNGITLRCVAAIPADQIDAHPIPNMRTPKELVVHTYASVIEACVTSLVTGVVPMDTEEKEPGLCAAIRTHDDLVRFCRAAWDAADQAALAATEAQLQSVIRTPFGADYPAGTLINIVRDELLHHRGQLFVYLRAMGAEPPAAWDFAHNEPAFRPAAAAGARK